MAWLQAGSSFKTQVYMFVIKSIDHDVRSSQQAGIHRANLATKHTTRRHTQLAAVINGLREHEPVALMSMPQQLGILLAVTG
jgi:hypothetical protein